MTDEIKRRLEAAGVRVKPLIWVKETSKRWASFNYIINDARDRDLYQGFIWGQVTQGWNEPVTTIEAAKAAAEAHHRTAVLAHLEVADD